MKSMKDLKVKKNKNYPPLHFMLFMAFMVNISYSSLSNPERGTLNPNNTWKHSSREFHRQVP